MGTPCVIESSIRNVNFGDGVKVVSPVNLYGCEIGNNCFIGPFVEIQKGAKIGDNTRIQSHAFICELVTIGTHCFISHGAMFINDTFRTGKPAGGCQNLWTKTCIGNRVSIGTNATILPITICNDVVIGAGSVVTKDILSPGIYAGNPVRLIRKIELDTNSI